MMGKPIRAVERKKIANEVKRTYIKALTKRVKVLEERVAQLEDKYETLSRYIRPIEQGAKKALPVSDKQL